MLAAALYAFSPTALAAAPSFLSDGLFTFLVAWVLFFTLRFLATGGIPHVLVAACLAAGAAHVRPINLYWMLPAAVLLLVARFRLGGASSESAS